jgi:hypothetical protein
MQLFGLKAHSYKTVKAMERIVKDNVKIGVNREFMKHAFVYDKHLFVGTPHKLIGLAINHLWGDVDSLKDNTMYDFKVSNWIKGIYTIELTEVGELQQAGGIDNVFKFNASSDMATRFNEIESWLAFSYRIGTFNFETMQDAFTIVEGKNIAIYFNKSYCGDVGSTKIESEYATMIYLPRISKGDLIKPFNYEEVKAFILVE